MKTMQRKRRSEPLTKDEHKAFSKYVSSFPTKIDAAFAIGVSRPTLDGILFRGTGRPDVIQTIRKKVQAYLKQAA
jgi:hypothetical protein